MWGREREEEGQNKKDRRRRKKKVRPDRLRYNLRRQNATVFI